MDTGRLLQEEAIPKFKNFYVKFSALEQKLKQGVVPTNEKGLLHRSFLERLLQQKEQWDAGGSSLHLQPASLRLGKTAAPQSSDTVGLLLKLELERLHRFVAAQLEELWVALTTLYEAAPASVIDSTTATLLDNDNDGRETVVPSSGSEQAGAEEMDGREQRQATAAEAGTLESLMCRIRSCWQRCDEIAADLVKIDEFVRQNAMACAVLAQRRDRELYQAARAAVAQPVAVATADGLERAGGVMDRIKSVHSSSSRSEEVPTASDEAGPDSRESEDSWTCLRPSQEQEGEQDVGAYVSIMMGLLLGPLHLDPHLVALSDLYSHLRQLQAQLHRLSCTSAGPTAGLHGSAGSGTMNGSGGWQPPDAFRRRTTKFWVHSADVVKLKCCILPHLPVLLLGDRERLQPGHSNTFRYFEKEATRDSTPISSVYLDSRDLQTYHERLLREDFAALIRLRWYNKRDPEAPEQQLFVERKQHREFWTGEFSMKHRVSLRQELLPGLLEGTSSPATLATDPTAVKLLQEVQDRVVGRKEEPLLRTQYRRTAYQESTTNAVRISLDTEVYMLRERGCPRRPQDWCRDMTAAVGPDDLVVFPYAILEVKLEESVEIPNWVQNLISSGLTVAMPKFSKFLHGTCMLYGDQIRNSPYWFLPMPNNTCAPATLEEMEDDHDPMEKHAWHWLFPKDFNPTQKHRNRRPWFAPTARQGQKKLRPAASGAQLAAPGAAPDGSTPAREPESGDARAASGAGAAQDVGHKRRPSSGSSSNNDSPTLAGLPSIFRNPSISFSSTAVVPFRGRRASGCAPLHQSAPDPITSAAPTPPVPHLPCRAPGVVADRAEHAPPGARLANRDALPPPLETRLLAGRSLGRRAGRRGGREGSRVPACSTAAGVASESVAACGPDGAAFVSASSASFSAADTPPTRAEPTDAARQAGAGASFFARSPASLPPADGGVAGGSDGSVMSMHSTISQDRHDSAGSHQDLGNSASPQHSQARAGTPFASVPVPRQARAQPSAERCRIPQDRGSGSDCRSSAAHRTPAEASASGAAGDPAAAQTQLQVQESADMRRGIQMVALPSSRLPAAATTRRADSASQSVAAGPPAGCELWLQMKPPRSLSARAEDLADVEIGTAATHTHSALAAHPREAGTASAHARIAGFCSSAHENDSGMDRRSGSDGLGALPVSSRKLHPRVPPLGRTRIEPKTFFANERTFLSWLSAGVLTAFIGLALLTRLGQRRDDPQQVLLLPGEGAASVPRSSNTYGCTPGDGACRAAQVSGSVITPAGILIMVYALWMFKRRTSQMLRREMGHYNDQIGPLAVTVLLASVSLLALVVSLVWVF